MQPQRLRQQAGQYPTVKPWNLETIKEKMKMVKESGAFAVAMDIDGAGLPFLKNLMPPAGSKTVENFMKWQRWQGFRLL